MIFSAQTVKGNSAFCVVSFFPSQMILLSGTVSSPSLFIFWDYRGDLNHELMSACSVNDMILVYSLVFHLVVTTVLLYREIRGPTSKVLSSGDRWSAYFRTSNPEMWFEDPDKYRHLKCQLPDKCNMNNLVPSCLEIKSMKNVRSGQTKSAASVCLKFSFGGTTE